MQDPKPTLWETVVSHTPEMHGDDQHEHEAAKFLAYHPVSHVDEIVKCDRASDEEKRLALRMVREAVHVALDDEEADTE
jgi:RNase P/RNase MRP subunit POP5